MRVQLSLSAKKDLPTKFEAITLCDWVEGHFTVGRESGPDSLYHGDAKMTGKEKKALIALGRFCKLKSQTLFRVVELGHAKIDPAVLKKLIGKKLKLDKKMLGNLYSFAKTEAAMREFFKVQYLENLEDFDPAQDRVWALCSCRVPAKYQVVDTTQAGKAIYAVPDPEEETGIPAMGEDILAYKWQQEVICELNPSMSLNVVRIAYTTTATGHKVHWLR